MRAACNIEYFLRREWMRRFDLSPYAHLVSHAECGEPCTSHGECADHWPYLRRVPQDLSDSRWYHAVYCTSRLYNNMDWTGVVLCPCGWLLQLLFQVLSC